LGIIKLDKSIIPACDVDTIEDYKKLVSATHHVEGIGGYKIGFSLALTYGLPMLVEETRKFTDLPLIYDHQKAATDIPDTGDSFAKVCKRAGVDAIILFPQSGPATEEAWIKAAQKEKLGVIVGGEMTHPKYKKSEGGYISDEALNDIYINAAKNNVTNFVVPGNKPDRIKHYRDLLTSNSVEPVFYAPGFVAQGGEISDAAKAAGDKWHAIVGRGIYAAKDMTAAAKEMTSKLR